MAKKVYAIKEGFNFDTEQKVENIIVDTWNECLKYVKGVKGAKYKSFEKLDEAKEYLEKSTGMLKKGIDEYPEDCLHVYVDGSYSIESKKYAYGLVCVKEGIIEKIESGKASDTSKSNIRQIAGELEAAVRGAKYALENNYKKIVLFHDYEGIAHHATGYWERREESSVTYYNQMNSLINEGLEIIFVKVDSHTGDLYNELADELCKYELDIPSDNVVGKYIKQNKIYVKNDKIRSQIVKLVSNNEENIIVEEKNTSKNDYDIKEIIKNIDKIINKLSDSQKKKVIDYYSKKFK